MSYAGGQSSGGWPSKVWQKCKEQPAVPLGAGATVVALIGSSYHLRSGNRARFNQFLRFRIYAQGLTVAALVIYGGMELSAKEKAGIVTRKDDRIVVYPRQRAQEAQEAQEAQKALDALNSPPEILADPAAVKPSDAYPLRKEDRMKVSEFAKRLRDAESYQKEDEFAKKA